MFPTSVHRKWEIETAKCNYKKLQQNNFGKEKYQKKKSENYFSNH